MFPGGDGLVEESIGIPCSMSDLLVAELVMVVQF